MRGPIHYMNRGVCVYVQLTNLYTCSLPQITHNDISADFRVNAAPGDCK